MKVIYDISVLGTSFYSQGARTGVARMIECLALQLMQEENLALYFCTFHNLTHYVQTLKYLEEGFLGKDIRFCHPDGTFAKNLTFSLASLYPRPTSNSITLSWQGKLQSIMKRLNHIWRGLDQEDLNSAEIFHSTHHPFPSYIKSSRNLKRFISICDLIPIKYPQYFPKNKNHPLLDVVRCIELEDWVIAISQSTKDDLCNYAKIDSSHVFVTPLAASNLFYPCLDCGQISAMKSKYGIPDMPYILSLCTMEPRKNIDRTIRCFVQLIKEQHINDLNLVLVGVKGWDFERIFSEIEYASSIRDRIIVTGYVQDQDLAAIYSGTMMFVYPSLYEGFGLPPLEAMQCGVPVITSNTSSLPEVVGDAGIMVDPADGESLSQAIFDIYSQSSLRISLSAKSLERAKLFSWERCAQLTVAAYKTALES